MKGCATQRRHWSSAMSIPLITQLVQTLNLLRPYKEKYLAMATDVRDRVAFSYKNGGSSLLDYLDSEKSYRDTKLAYLNLIGSYLTAAAQMNLAA